MYNHGTEIRDIGNNRLCACPKMKIFVTYTKTPTTLGDYIIECQEKEIEVRVCLNLT